MQDQRMLFVNKWADALESGRYKQCFGLSSVFREGEVYFCAVTVGDTVLKELGLGSEMVDNLGIDCRAVVEANDSGRMTFPQIAEKLRAGGYDRR